MEDIEIRISGDRVRSWGIKVVLLAVLPLSVLWALLPPLNRFAYRWGLVLLLPVLSAAQILRASKIKMPVVVLSSNELKVLTKGSDELIDIPWNEILKVTLSNRVYITLTLRDEDLVNRQLTMSQRISRAIAMRAMSKEGFTFSAFCLEVTPSELVDLICQRAKQAKKGL